MEEIIFISMEEIIFLMQMSMAVGVFNHEKVDLKEYKDMSFPKTERNGDT